MTPELLVIVKIAASMLLTTVLKQIIAFLGFFMMLKPNPRATKAVKTAKKLAVAVPLFVTNVTGMIFILSLVNSYLPTGNLAVPTWLTVIIILLAAINISKYLENMRQQIKARQISTNDIAMSRFLLKAFMKSLFLLPLLIFQDNPALYGMVLAGIIPLLPPIKHYGRQKSKLYASIQSQIKMDADNIGTNAAENTSAESVTEHRNANQ